MTVPDQMETVRELATHANEIKHLQADMDRLVADMDAIKQTLDAINETLATAKGGWKTLMAVGGFCTVLGGVVAWVLEHLGK